MPSVVEAAGRVRRGEQSAEELVRASLEAVGTRRRTAQAPRAPRRRDATLGEARAVDAAVRRGEDVGPLAGVPFGVKDLEDCAGLPTTKGSRWFAGQPPKITDSLHVAAGSGRPAPSPSARPPHRSSGRGPTRRARSWA